MHRDIKPHNVLVDGEGRVKVTDFGIARAGTSQMTETGSIVGTAQYLSPEQARGGEVDPRSDLYSLGVVLYELLTGKTPFDGETPVEIAMKHLSNAPQPPSKLRPDIPPELDMVVLRALAKNPDDRYQSADEMEADLERVARGARVSATTADTATQVLRRPAAAAAAASATAATMIAPRSTAAADVPPTVVEEEEEYEEGGERPLWPWLVAAGFVIAAIIAGFFVYQELSGSKATVPVNNYVNEQQSHAEQQIRAAHLVPAVKKGPSERYKHGIVFRQDPSVGSKLEKGGTVTIWVSTGPPKVTVPPVKGQQWPDAQQALVNAGLKPVEFIVPGEPKGQVAATDPGVGERVPKGSKVRVNVYSGPATAAVPSVVGLSINEATSKLHAAGFNANPTFVNNSTAPQGQVISQHPTPGTTATKGTTVDLNVSNGPPEVTVPDVVGYTSQQAVSTLEAAGFQVTQQYSSTDPSQDNIVQGQNPLGRLPGGEGLDGDDHDRPALAGATAAADDDHDPLTSRPPSPRGHPRGRPLERARDLPGVGALGRRGSPSGAVRDRRGRDRPRRTVGPRSGRTWPLRPRPGARHRDGSGGDIARSGRVRDARGARRRGRRPPHPARAVRRGRDGAGAARARRRPLRRRRRRCVGARDGQGPVQEGHARQRHPGRGAPRDPARRRGREPVRLPRVRQARTARLVGRHHEGARRGGARAGGRARVPARREGAGGGVRRGHGGRGRRPRQPRAAAVASLPGQIDTLEHEWYDYASKYDEGGMELLVPPPGLPEETIELLQRRAVDSFVASECEGLARVDFFVRESDGEVVLNELNTMPGFTATSVWARLFEASGLGYAEALDRLIELALERHERRSKLVY